MNTMKLCISENVHFIAKTSKMHKIGHISVRDISKPHVSILFITPTIIHIFPEFSLYLL